MHPFEGIAGDVRHAARTLARTPGFVAVAVLTLAIAIGVGTSLFTAVNGFVYRPLPVPGGGELLSVFTSNWSGRETQGGSSYRDLQSFAEATGALAEIAGEAHVTLGIGDGVDGRATLVPGAIVTPNYFRALRLVPARGTLATAARPDAPTIVLGHALWRRAFASDPGIVGRTVQVNGLAFTVAAVAPREFLGTTREVTDEFWIDAAFAPLLLPRVDVLHARGDRRFHLVGRLRDGATADAVQARLAGVAARLAAAEPDAWRDSTGRARRVSVQREQDARLAGITRGDLLLLVGGVVALGLGLLAVASTNLAGLQLARTAARRREIATRLALGAGRARLVRQLLAESALVALPGALLGVLLSMAVSAAAMHYRPSGLPNADLSPDARTLLFVASGLLLVLLLFGLLPAAQGVRGDLVADLKGSGHTAAGGPRGAGRIGGVRGALIVAQVALSVAFTAVSGLVAFALARRAQESRVDGDRVLVAPLALLPAAGDSVRAAALVRELVDVVERTPGVEAASVARYVPIPGERLTVMAAPGDGAGRTTPREIDANLVRPRYFGVTGLPLLRGRDFDERDLRGGARVAVVSGAMAARLWPGVDPMGRQLRVNEEAAPYEIVGVVGELRAAPGGGPTAAPGGLLYLPLRPEGEDRLVLHVRAVGATALAPWLAPRIARALRPYGARVVAPDVLPIDRYMERAVMPARMMARVSALLAALQLVLAVAGLSGLVAYVTALRQREIGIRAALGAQRGRILALVLGLALKLTAIGGAIGIVLSLAFGRVVAAMLPVSSMVELRALGVAVLGFGIVAGVAMLIPARRATAVPPAAALRVE
ncbi:ABC transporter permease [Roseisolibacter agri]|uniref:Macrolide export ATP-binding/permease protein MacB n=1 Tax=Roseisolibacter agri TaxID=2014610 RepID=A0AA37QBU3_9BACT|nr:ABC transporter permease [Roseisolibacter agri]GLC23808.1 hypothetical protein rosag_03210 [Roseisolibacter agri]